MRRLGRLALAVATAVLLSWPLVRHPTTRLLDDGTLDGFGFTWTLWWVRSALLAGQDPFFTRALFYPDGVELFWHALCLPAGVLSLPLALAGPGFRAAVLAQNAMTLFATVATLLVGAALARAVTGRGGAGLLAGLLLVANGFHVRQLHTPNIASVYWLVAVLLVWLRLHAARRWTHVVALAAVVAALFLAAPEYAAMALALLVFDLLWRVGARSAVWLAGGAAGIVATALVPAAIVALAGSAAPEPPAWYQVVWNSAYVTAFVTPPWLVTPPSYVGHETYLGVVALALAAAGQLLAPREATRWNVAAALCLVAALGPLLQLGAPGIEFYRHPEAPPAWPGWPLPYRLAYDLVPGFSIGRAPWRWVAAARVCLALAAACGAAALAARLAGRPRLRALGTALLVGVALAETWPERLPAVAATLPAGYDVIARDPGEGGVLELPSGLRHGAIGLYSSLYMPYQAAHRHPLLEGTLARLPPGRRYVFARRDFHVATAPGLGWAVLHRALFRRVYPPGPSRRLAREVRRAGTLVFRSRELRIYRLPGRDAASPIPPRRPAVPRPAAPTS